MSAWWPFLSSGESGYKITLSAYILLGSLLMPIAGEAALYFY